jgi:hypothetical protein
MYNIMVNSHHFTLYSSLTPKLDSECGEIHTIVSSICGRPLVLPCFLWCYFTIVHLHIMVSHHYPARCDHLLAKVCEHPCVQIREHLVVMPCAVCPCPLVQHIMMAGQSRHLNAL